MTENKYQLEVEKPELLKDKFWNEIIPSDMPYTVGAQPYKAQEFKGSAEMTLDVKEGDKIYSGSNYYAGVTVGKLNVSIDALSVVLKKYSVSKFFF